MSSLTNAAINMTDLIPSFLLLALAGGICVAVMAGPLGAFVVWRKMAYFGDTLAHGALLGIALGIFLSINPFITLLIACVTLALLLGFLQKQQRLGSDTILGILSHGALAAGLVCISLIENARVDVMAFLFGDLLTITPTDIYLFLLIDFIVLGSLTYFWRPLLLATLDENLAKAEGVATETLRIVLLVLMALVVAIAMRVVGILLITALFIIPAAAARPISENPEPMVIFATLIGTGSIALGLFCSYHWDTPAGPSIVLSSLLIFFLTSSFSFFRAKLY